MGVARAGGACWLHSSVGAPPGRPFRANRILLVCLPFLLWSSLAGAITPAGTVVTNTAAATFDGGSATSDPVSFTVAQVAGFTLFAPVTQSSGPDGQIRYYALVVENTGNGTDGAAIDVASALGWPVTVCRDDNGDGIHQSTETTVLSDTGPLSAGAFCAAIVAVSVPPGVYGTETTMLTLTSDFDAGSSADAAFLTTSVPPSPPVPQAGFLASPVNGPAPLTVHFTDTSTNAPTSWAWDFGDGSISSEQNPVHQYQSAGSYMVSLTAASAAGYSTKTCPGFISVGPSSALTADFTASVRSGPVPLAVTFTDLSTGDPTAWRWNFGDGEGAGEQNPVHTYSRGGAYTVTLTAVAGDAESTAQKVRYVVVDFPDVPNGYWAYPEVMACVRAGVVAGYPQGMYYPLSAVSRDQMATFLARAVCGGEEHVPNAPAEASFADVPEGYWAFRYVEYLAAQHVAAGYPNGLFQPALTVDRGQMAVFVARGMAQQTGSGGGTAGGDPLGDYAPPVERTFNDVGTDYWAYRYVEYAAQHNVVQGYPDGSYRPDLSVTRDQMAVYLARAFGLPW